MRNQPKYHFFKNWSYAVKGLREIYANESSFRLEILIFSLASITLFFWDFGLVLNLFLIFSMALVLVAECVNSGLERIVDLASPEFNPLAGAAKDAGSAAVMICNFLCGLLWVYAIFVRLVG